MEYALRLIDSGMSFEEVVERLEADKGRIRLVALLDTLEYLKKGGRISKAAALAGSLLTIKPVIAILQGEVAILGKARSTSGSLFSWGTRDSAMPCCRNILRIMKLYGRTRWTHWRLPA